MSMIVEDLEKTAISIAERFPGPGGVLAVVRDGEPLIARAWGYADTSGSRLMSCKTIFPICSITKQFTCALLVDLFPDAETELSKILREFLPNLKGQRPTILDLCNNQSGIRDYATLSILSGAAADGVFTRANTRSILEQTASLQFAPGTEYCYSNSNFYLLACLIEEATGKDFGEMLRERIFTPASMRTAKFVADSAAYPVDCTGYEGNFNSGFSPAINRSHWIGDAGISASLEDMICWERFVQKSSKREGSLYNKISAQQFFLNGSPAPYGYGLAHGLVDNLKVVEHSGGMRGWRMHRVFARDLSLSAIVMFNHEADAKGAAHSLIAALVNTADIPNEPNATHYYVNRSRYLLAEVVSTPAVECMVVAEGDEATLLPGSSQLVGSRTHIAEGELKLVRPTADFWRVYKKLSVAAKEKLEGRFFCEELSAMLVVRETCGITYGSFQGPFGTSDPFILKSLGRDVWQTPNLRGIDVAPGPLSIMRASSPQGIETLHVSAPLAQNVVFSYVVQ